MKKKFQLLRDRPVKYSQAKSQNVISFKEFTFGYIAVCFLILIGAPAQYTGTRYLASADSLPTVIGLMAGGYFFILALVLGLGKIRKMFVK